MSDRDHQQWLYTSDKGRVEPFSGTLESVVSGRPVGEGKKGEDVPKDYEAIRSWLEYANTKTWLIDASRVPDKSTTLSALPREHQVAVPLPSGEVEKWLVRPTTDVLAGQLQTKLVLSSENSPWLVSRAPKHDGNAITAHFSAVLSSPSSQWLSKRSSKSDDLTKWLLEPKKARSIPTSSLDPLSSWKTYQAGIEWLASPFNQKSEEDTNPMNDASGEDDYMLVLPSSAPTSLPLPFSNRQQMGIDIDKWLLPSASPSFSSLPLFKSANTAETVGTLDQWLLRPRSPSEPESEASLLSISSEYELINEL